MVGFPRRIISLQQVAAGGAQHEGVEEMRDERDLRGAARRQIQPLHAQHHAPTANAQNDGQLHEPEGKQQGGPVNQHQCVPEFGRSRRPRLAPLLYPRQPAPGAALPLPGQPALVEENGVENPEHQQPANPESPADPPDFPRCAHGLPQMPFKCSTPLFTSSTATPGPNSNTLMCSGLTIGFNAAKSIMPEPGGQ